MKRLTVVVLAAFATVTSAVDESKIHTFVDPATNQTIRHFDCGVDRGKASAHFNETLRFLHRNSRHHAHGGSLKAAVVRRSAVDPALNIKTYMHLVTTTAKKDSLTKQMANDQLDAMNKAYKPIGISFTLADVSIDANDAWAVSDGDDMDALKKARRQGTYADLNLYFHTDLSGGQLGTCTMPDKVTKDMPKDMYFSDGCNVDAATMPGGEREGYNQGMTAVHETGHWLGLFHTFEGYSCDGDGDSIDDTPVQSESTDGCPADKPAKDSCPDQSGVDPIHNYMDYSSDDCYNNFTPGQVARIQELWEKYRKGM